MAETFVARSERAPRADEVCLKRLAPALAADPAQRAHFADEGRVLSRMCHPNVLALLDAGQDAEGPYLVTELIDGIDLRRFLAWLASMGEPMPEPLALRIAREVADALAHAHPRGIVHRDVTPANILLGRDGRVVLIDFGIARSDAQTQRTRTGFVKGKAAYMAPEQALGGALDARADLFALGVVLFEMLAGRRPHDGASEVETVTNAIRGARRTLSRPLSSAELGELLDALLRAAPAERPADAAAVVRSLAAHPVADAAELAAWVRAAADEPEPPARGPIEGSTRRKRAARAQTATQPEHEIPTREDLPGRAALHDARTREVPELDPPTVVDGVPFSLRHGAEDTLITPRPTTSAGPSAGLGVHSTTTTALGAWGRGLAALALGVLAGGLTGAAAALVLRWVI